MTLPYCPILPLCHLCERSSRCLGRHSEASPPFQLNCWVNLACASVRPYRAVTCGQSPGGRESDIVANIHSNRKAGDTKTMGVAKPSVLRTEGNDLNSLRFQRLAQRAPGEPPTCLQPRARLVDVGSVTVVTREAANARAAPEEGARLARSFVVALASDGR